MIRFKEFIENKFANVTGEEQDFPKSNDEIGTFNPHEINHVSSYYTTVPLIRDHYPVSVRSGSLSTDSNYKLPKLSLPTFQQIRLALFWGII